MFRLVRHDATGPIEVKSQEKSILVCACGLSQNLPYCDGSHTKIRNETAGKLCIYNKARTAVPRTTTDA